MADVRKLHDLFDALAGELITAIVEGRTVTDPKTGEVFHLTPDAATLGVARQFLKDNGIEADPEENENLRRLRQGLPFDEDDEPQSSQL